MTSTHCPRLEHKSGDLQWIGRHSVNAKSKNTTYNNFRKKKTTLDVPGSSQTSPTCPWPHKARMAFISLVWLPSRETWNPLVMERRASRNASWFISPRAFRCYGPPAHWANMAARKIHHSSMPFQTRILPSIHPSSHPAIDQSVNRSLNLECKL